MKPWAVAAEKELTGSSASDSLNYIVKSANSSGICEDIWKPAKLIDDLLLRSPIVHKTSQMRNDEVYSRILRGKQLNQIGPPYYIDQNWDSILLSRIADFPG